MKNNLFNQNPEFKKWILASGLVIALGANLSLNPETKTLARNDSQLSGEFSYASKVKLLSDLAREQAMKEEKNNPYPHSNPALPNISTSESVAVAVPTQPEVLKIKETVGKSVELSSDPNEYVKRDLKLDDKYKGLSITTYTNNKGHVVYTVYRNSDANLKELEAVTCVNCAEKEVFTLNLKEEVQKINDLSLINKIIVKQAEEELGKLAKKEETKEDKVEEKKQARKKKEDKNHFNWEDKTYCDSEEFDPETVGFDADCMKDEFDDLLSDCIDFAKERKEEEKETLATERKSNKKIRRSSVKANVNAICSRFTKEYYQQQASQAIKFGMGQDQGTEAHVGAVKLANTFLYRAQSRPSLFSKDITRNIGQSMKSGHVQIAKNTFEGLFKLIQQRNMNCQMAGLSNCGTAADALKQAAFYANGTLMSLYQREGTPAYNLYNGMSVRTQDNSYITGYIQDYKNPLDNLLQGLTNYTTQANIDQGGVQRLFENADSSFGGIPGLGNNNSISPNENSRSGVRPNTGREANIDQNKFRTSMQPAARPGVPYQNNQMAPASGNINYPASSGTNAFGTRPLGRQ